jgi:hypothetical protein
MSERRCAAAGSPSAASKPVALRAGTANRPESAFWFPTEGLVKFVVEYNGRGSALVAVPFAPKTVRISLKGEAYVHMPIWLDVALPDPLRANFRYPMTRAFSAPLARTVVCESR